MLAKCISTNCPKSSLCKRALSDSTAHVNYKYAGCDEDNKYMWYTEIEQSVNDVQSASKSDLDENETNENTTESEVINGTERGV